jgi:uncharacterized protein YndB with AHSA1/START domain
VRRWIIIPILTIAALLAVLVLIGLALPTTHVASQSDWFAAPPERVWEAITAVESYPAWRREMDSVQVLESGDGRLAWREYGSFGRISYEAVVMERPRTFTSRITDEDLGFGGRWTYTLMPDRDGTSLTITEDGQITNPLFRVISRIAGYTATMRAFLDELRSRVDTTATPVAPTDSVAT